MVLQMLITLTPGDIDRTSAARMGTWPGKQYFGFILKRYSEVSDIYQKY